jgi:hypothetical protein
VYANGTLNIEMKQLQPGEHCPGYVSVRRVAAAAVLFTLMLAGFGAWFKVAHSRASPTLEELGQCWLGLIEVYKAALNMR